MAVTWNPADKGASITLSGGNLIATKASADEVYALVRATQSRSEGKRYYECRLSAGSGTPGAGIGLALSSASVNNYIGATGSAGYYPDGVYGLGDSFPGTIGEYVVGDWTRVAVDLDTGKIWLGNEDGWNGGDPAAGTGQHLTWPSANPVLFPAAALYRTGEQWTANFGGSTFQFSVPSGFEAWDAEPPITGTMDAELPGYTATMTGKAGVPIGALPPSWRGDGTADDAHRVVARDRRRLCPGPRRRLVDPQTSF